MVGNLHVHPTSHADELWSARAPEPPVDVELRCPDLDEAQTYFCERLGFRLQSVFPAEAPRELIVEGQGRRIRLSAQASRRAAGDDGWTRGRAGMQYRNVLPDSGDHDLIVSHIRIPDGGPVPDYVHHHDVRFQMIYCQRGWVRVVYEGQGDPFKLEPGDCVLQPPGIRHRVLECSEGLEVFEISSPAEHVTQVDHDLALPSKRLDSDHTWDSQRFVRHQASGARWMPSVWPGFETCDLGGQGRDRRAGLRQSSAMRRPNRGGAVAAQPCAVATPRPPRHDRLRGPQPSHRHPAARASRRRPPRGRRHVHRPVRRPARAGDRSRRPAVTLRCVERCSRTASEAFHHFETDEQAVLLLAHRRQRLALLVVGRLSELPGIATRLFEHFQRGAVREHHQG